VLAGNSLAQLSDPRFDPEHGYLPTAPLLGFVEIPAGAFTLGREAKEDSLWLKARPAHSMTLPRFYLARWPVTVAQFRAFVEASGYQPADPNCLKGFVNHPVVWVSWHDALAYCHWLGEQLRELAQARLLQVEKGSELERAFWQGLAEGTLTVTVPSEAEWEKAAKGGESRAYPWGNEPDANKANYADTGIGATSPVGCFPKGASPYGGEEMSGNVWEWTRSLRADYPYPDQEKPRRQREDLRAKGDRVLRGGAFYYGAEFVRCAFRGSGSLDARNHDIGFRVVVSPFFLTDESSEL
jgi:formylglycine-generating enzyme required for sulfatase activity